MSDFDYFQQDEIRQAVRDILFMYAESIYDYGGFGHAIETGSFDAFKFLEVDSEKVGYFPSPATIQLLKEGALVKIFCELYDAWCEHETFDYSFFDRHRTWLSDGRFWEFPEAEALMKRLFKESPDMSVSWVEDEFKRLHDKYVRRYFLELVNSD